MRFSRGSDCYVGDELGHVLPVLLAPLWERQMGDREASNVVVTHWAERW